MKQALTLLAGTVALAACTSAPAPAPAVPAPEPAVEQPVATPVPVEPEIVEPKPLVVDLSHIENATPADVISYMGAPSLVRRDENVQVMIFEAERCVVEIVFYEPEDGDHFRSEWITARLKSGQDMETISCARQWLEENLPEQ